MAIIPDQKYALKGSQIEDLASRIGDNTEDIETLEAQIQALATDFSYKGSVEDYDHLPSDAATGDVYTTTDTGIIYVWDGNAWVALNEYPDVFVGTDGTSAGEEGLVPAPTVADVSKILSADGTWADRDIKVITALDYSGNTLEPFLLDPGIYKLDTSKGNIKTLTGDSTTITTNQPAYLFVMGADAPSPAAGSSKKTRSWVLFANANNGSNSSAKNRIYISYFWYLRSDDQWLSTQTNRLAAGESFGAVLTNGALINSDLDTVGNEAATNPPTASVVKIHTSKRVLRGSTAPTTSTQGEIGTIYENTTDGSLSVCTAKSGSGTQADPYVYTWTQITTGGSLPTVVQTIRGASTTDVPSQVAVRDAIFTKDTLFNTLSGVAISPSTSWDLSANKYLCLVGETNAGIHTDPSINATVIGRASGVKNGGVYIGCGTQNLSSYTVGGGGVFNTAIGAGAQIYGSSAHCINIGDAANVGAFGEISNKHDYSIVIGSNAKNAYNVDTAGSISLGAYSNAQEKGEMNIGSSQTAYGYNNTNYRLLTGVHDPQNAHDAATKGYVDTAVAGAGSATINSTDWSALWQ